MAAWSSEKVTDGSRVRFAVFPSDEVTRILLCAGFPEVGLGGEGGVVEEVGGGGETPRTCVYVSVGGGGEGARRDSGGGKGEERRFHVNRLISYIQLYIHLPRTC